MTNPSSGAPDGGLPLNAKKEQISLGFVHMVASAAGCSVKYHLTDYDGVDITISSSAEYQLWSSPDLELQVKCTSQRDRLQADALSWEMKADPYRKLTDPKRFNPAYLAVLLVPDDPEAWLDQDEARLITSSCMYWEKASNLPAIAAGATSKTVRLPRSNLFDVEQLRGIMKSIGEGR